MPAMCSAVHFPEISRTQRLWRETAMLTEHMLHLENSQWVSLVEIRYFMRRIVSNYHYSRKPQLGTQRP